ncbi:MAG: cofactor-independent phosphoglycerate mutase [Clostridiales bacterium]|nr:cofactor-independent phosphoglycerate mutase [Clostridiales bacterium]
MKIIVFLGDGMADLPHPTLGNRTPLDVSAHPHMDALASAAALFGMVQTIPEDMPAGSDVANLAVLGYDPARRYTGRSSLEAVSMGIELAETDVCYRCNLVTFSETDNLEDAILLDYSAGEIPTEEAHALIAKLAVGLPLQNADLHAGISYRNCLVLHNAQGGADLTPPHDITGQPVREYLPKGTNAEILLSYMQAARALLSEHPANGIWFWGEGKKPRLPNFRETFGLRGAMISAIDLLHGIALCAGMERIRVPGATGDYHTDYAAKARAAIAALQNGADYVYIHVEAADECGHRRQVREKCYAIEQIDAKIVGPVMAWLQNCGEDFAALLLPDHPTPLSLGTHSAAPVPFALYKKGDNAARHIRYCEQSAEKTGLFIANAPDLMQIMIRQED